jgi:fatty-acyl-CoA synthase
VSDRADVDVNGGATLGDLFLRAIRRYGDRIALVDDYESLTYRQFGTRVGQYLADFRVADLPRGAGLAQLSTNCADAVAVIAAGWIHGLRYTPLHPRGTPQDHAFIIEDAEIEALAIDTRSFPNAIQELGAHLTGRRTIIKHREANPREDSTGAVLPRGRAAQPPFSENNIAAVLYTGGTTGTPKGVVHRHRSLVANALIELAEFEWPPEVRFLAVTPISHAALGFILPVFIRGGAFVLHRQFSPAGFFAAVAKLHVTATFLVPTMLNALLDSPEAKSANTTSLQMLVYGASPIAPSRLRQAIDRLGDVFVQMYGQTEAPNVIAVLRRSEHDANSLERLASCGVPSASLDVRLLNEAGSEVGPGEVGEVCVRGPLVMDRYWNRPAETAATLAGGWLHTGDLARADDAGYLTIVDRKKDLIISGGFNIIPREIEDILNSHPAVSQACVIGVPDPKWGEAVKAIVITRQGERVSADELTRLVRETKGATYVPKTIDFVDSIPMTPVGKPDKKALRAPFWRGHARQVV